MQEPLYAFQLDNPPLDAAGQPFTYLQAQFQLPGDTVDGQMGAYFGAGKGARACNLRLSASLQIC